MANDVTIDELQIKIEAESGTAASNLDDLAKSLDRLQTVTQRMTGGGDGLNKVAKQIEKLNAISQKIQSMRGFERLGKVVNQLSKLDRLSNVGDISGLVRNLNKLPQAVNAIAQMPSIDATKFQQIADALKPLNDLGTNNINSFLRTLGKFPQTAQQLAGVDLTQFEQQIRRISTSLEPLTRQAERGGAGLTALAHIMQSTSRQARQSSDGVSLFNQTLGQIKVKTLAAIAGLRRLFSVLKSSVTTSNDYVENLNLFTVTMGGAADEALRFANTVNDLMGIDVSQWIQNQGVFKQMASGFGMVDEKANLLSKNLTQIGYDIASYYNISTESAMQKLQSGLAGEIMPLRSLGYALDEATIKQVALNHGITESVTNMSQAQKAQLRYIAIMEQSTNAMGDMARTIDSPANQIRILEARIQTLKRAIGDSLMPVVSAALPYITAFVQILGEAFRGLAEFMGFELPEFDYSDVMTKQNENIANSFDDATEASNKFKGTLASIDQLNIIGSKDEGKSAAGNENQFDLGIELPEYDFLQGVESKTKQIAENIKGILPWVEALAAAIGTIFIGKKVYDLIDALPKLGKVIQTVGGLLTGEFGKAGKIFSGIVGGLAAGASSGILLNNSIKNLITGTGKLGGNIAMLVGGLGIAGGAIATFIKLGNPVGAVITGIGAAIGILSGVISGNIENMKKFDEELNNAITYADNGGISIQGLTDGFKGYFDSITNGYDDILTNTAAFKDNETKINGAVTEVKNLVDKYTLLDQTITTDDAETLAANVKIIGDGIQTNLGTATQGIVDTLKTKFHDFAVGLGQDVDDMVTKFYLLESMGNTALATTRQRADELAASLSSGKLSAEEQKQVFTDLETTIKAMGTSDVGTKEQMSFERAIQEMSTAKIKFDSPDTVKAQIAELDEMANQARSSITTAYNDQTFELEQMKRHYETMINLNTGNTVKYDFDQAMGAGAFDKLFEATQAVYDKAKETNLSKIDTGEAVYLTMLQNQLNENEHKYATTKFNEVGPGMGSTLQNFARWGWSDDAGEKLYKLGIKNYEKEYRDRNSEIYDLIGGSLERLNLTPQGKEIGGYLVEGMANGALAKQEDLNRALDAAANGAIDEVKRVCGVHSPSTVFAEIGGYLMRGMALGIDKDRHDVISSLDDTTKAMFSKMHRLSFNIPTFNTDNSAIAMDMNTVYEKVRKENASFNNSYTLPRGAAAIGGAVGVAREAFPNAAQAAAANSDAVSDIKINLQSFVEIDGEQVGQAVSQYQQRQTLYSNGR